MPVGRIRTAGLVGLLAALLGLGAAWCADKIVWEDTILEQVERETENIPAVYGGSMYSSGNQHYSGK